jgi:tetratricopeptide (TPR) repeat protein
MRYRLDVEALSQRSEIVMNPESADLARLVEAVQNNPSDAKSVYLLGAEFASLGRYDEAVNAMRHAVALDPTLHMARFQLGLLHLTSARPAEAIDAWTPLEALPREAYLLQFKHGLEALIRDDFAACITQLESGIRANQENAALNRDMAMLIERVRPALIEPASAAAPAAPTTQEPAAVRTDFSLYERTTKH